MRSALALSLTLLAAVGLDACRGGQSTQRQPGPQKTVQGHACTPQDEAMQCVLARQKFTVSRPPSAVIARGIDFAWGAPSAAEAKSHYGAAFGASYLSFDASKGWAQRAGLVADYHAHGLGTVAVWETSARRASAGRAAGEADARTARGQAATLGNTASTIYFAIDYEARGAEIDGYFRGVHAILGARSGAYGSYGALGYLCGAHLIGKGWQTYAWSGGRWLPASCAPLEQYLNDDRVDYDRALATDYGQWPSPASDAKARKRAELRRERRLVAARHALIDRHHCRSGPPWYGHAKPRSYHTACGHWLAKGKAGHARIRRLETEIAA